MTFLGLREAISRARAGIFNALRTHIIIDREPIPSKLDAGNVTYDYSLRKEEVARDFIFSMEGSGLTFLDVGGRDGQLSYLFGVIKNLDIDRKLEAVNSKRFHEKYVYHGLDLSPSENSRILAGDVCKTSFLQTYPQYLNYFDVVYSNNVFEHLRKPWIAAENLYAMMKPGGICITIVPFSLRYHEVPGDYFRYTHTCIPALFEDIGPVETLLSGYDTTGRRNNWQGLGVGTYNDTVPVDHFGAWRENWFVVTVLRKPASAGESKHSNPPATT